LAEITTELSAPWEKLTTSVALDINTKPSAIKAYKHPIAMPAGMIWKISATKVLLPLRAAYEAQY
jgi:hypothetical protein